MDEMIEGSSKRQHSISNPDLLSPKMPGVPEVDRVDSNNSEENTPRGGPKKRGSSRAGSARSRQNNFVEDVEKVKPYIQPQVL